MNLGLSVLVVFPSLRRTAEVTARLAAELAETAVGTWILFRLCLVVHTYIVQPSARLHSCIFSAYDTVLELISKLGYAGESRHPATLVF
jgi:hypothetical protein